MWIRDLQSSIPLGSDATFIGTDLNAHYFPKEHGANTTYQVQDINQPWPTEWRNSFDLVHQRLVLAGAGLAQSTAIMHLGELVKPGGWMQLIEGENVPDPRDGPAMHHFIAIMKDVFRAMAVDGSFARHLYGWVQAAGFSEVQERVVDCYMGATNKDAELARLGVGSTCIAAAGLVSFAKSQFNSVQSCGAYALSVPSFFLSSSVSQSWIL